MTSSQRLFRCFSLAAVVLALAACGSSAPAGSAAASSSAPLAGSASGSAASAPVSSASASAAPASSAAPSGAASSAAPASAGASGPSSIAVKVGYPSQGGNLAALWAADSAGLFKQNGLDAQVIYIAHSPTTIKALVANEVQFAVVGASASVQAALAGSDVVLVATAAPGLAYRIYARPGINSLHDLKGKRIVESGQGTDPDFALRMVLQKNNMSYSDVEVMSVLSGGDPGRLAALKASGAEAVILGPGIFHKAETEFGLHLLVDIIKQDIPYEAATVATTRSYVKQHPEAVQRFVKTFTEGLHWVRGHRDDTIKIIEKYSQNDDPVVAGEMYDYYVGSVFPKAPYVNQAGVQTLIDLVAEKNPAARNHKAAEFIDNDFVKKLEDEGFINQLYAKS